MAGKHVDDNERRSMAPAEDLSVPIYLPDRTEVGRAVIIDDRLMVEIYFEKDSFLGSLFKEEVIGLSVMYLSARAEDIIEEEKEKTDGRND